jgi:hypothetical protein
MRFSHGCIARYAPAGFEPAGLDLERCGGANLRLDRVARRGDARRNSGPTNADMYLSRTGTESL